jgi:hypothetical protein
VADTAVHSVAMHAGKHPVERLTDLIPQPY